MLLIDCHRPLRYVICYDGILRPSAVKRWSLSLSVRLFSCLTLALRQLDRRADPNYFVPLSVGYSVFEDDWRSCRPSGPHIFLLWIICHLHLFLSVLSCACARVKPQNFSATFTPSYKYMDAGIFIWNCRRNLFQLWGFTLSVKWVFKSINWFFVFFFAKTNFILQICGFGRHVDIDR